MARRAQADGSPIGDVWVDSLNYGSDGTKALSETELDTINGVTAGTAAASKAVVLDANADAAGQRHDTISGNRLTTGGVGTVTTSATTTAEEHGDAVNHLTKLTLTAFAVGTSGDNEDLAIGASLYTLPAGAIYIESASFVGTIDADTSEATIADGEIALGTVVGTGAVDTTGEVAAAAENVAGPIVVTTGEFDGAQVYAGVLASNLYIAATGGLAHELFFNIAATWPNVTAAGAVTATGVVTLHWRKIS